MSGNGLAIQFGKPDSPEQNYQMTFQLDGSGQHGSLFLTDPSRAALFPFVIPPAMLDELIALSLLSRRRGMLLHACESMQMGRPPFSQASPFPARRLPPACGRLIQLRPAGDERVAIRRQEDRLQVYATHGSVQNLPLSPAPPR